MHYRAGMMLAGRAEWLYSRPMIHVASDPLLDRITQVIVERFSPERIVLFGSRARGDHHEESDYDLIVVLETAIERGDRAKQLYAAIGHVPGGVDFIVHTPAEYDRRRGDVGAMAHAGEVEGRVLYDRNPARWARRVREQPQGLPESLGEWLERARNDYESMAALIPRDAIAFHAHQATEKLIKSVLIAGHVRPPRTHELRKLLPIAPAELRDDAAVRQACVTLDQVYPQSRYPGAAMPTQEEVEGAVAAARLVLDRVRATALIPPELL